MGIFTRILEAIFCSDLDHEEEFIDLHETDESLEARIANLEAIVSDMKTSETKRARNRRRHRNAITSSVVESPIYPEPIIESYDIPTAPEPEITKTKTVTPKQIQAVHRLHNFLHPSKPLPGVRKAL